MTQNQAKSARQIKEEKVESLAEKIKRAKTITFANYHGLKAGQIGQLRDQIKESGGEFMVEKNSLIKLALTKNRLPAPSDQLTGATAATLAYDDEIAPVRDVAKSKKDLGFPIFKFGFFGKELLEESALEKLSQIPDRNTLQASLISSLNAPINRLILSLSASTRYLVSILDQISKKGVVN